MMELATDRGSSRLPRYNDLLSTRAELLCVLGIMILDTYRCGCRGGGGDDEVERDIVILLACVDPCLSCTHF